VQRTGILLVNHIKYFGNFKDRAVLKKEFVHKTVGPAFPIILTLHGMVLLEKNWLAQYDWKYVVVDEVMQKHTYLNHFLVTTSHAFLLFVFSSQSQT
jgi:hypothetical protein